MEIEGLHHIEITNCITLWDGSKKLEFTFLDGLLKNKAFKIDIEYTEIDGD